MTIGIEEGIFLLKAKPRLGFLGLLHDFGSMVTEVGPVGGSVVVVGLGENENVVATAEGVFEDGGGSEVDI